MHRDTLRLVELLCTKPRMYVQDRTYAAVCAYLDGYDRARGGSVLAGFREFLLTGGAGWSELPWWALVRRRVSDVEDLAVPPTTEEDATLIAALLEAVQAYSKALNDDRGGLPKSTTSTASGCSRSRIRS